MQSEIFQRMRAVPVLVHLIITQASRRRAEGTIPESVFEEQMRRLEREALNPKGLALIVRDLTAGRTRFLIKEKATGTVCDMMDFAKDGTLESDSFESFAQGSSTSSADEPAVTPSS